MLRTVGSMSENPVLSEFIRRQEQFMEDIRKELSEWRGPSKRSYAMSKLSSRVADTLLQSLSLSWRDGNELFKIVPPDDAPAISPFGRMHEFPGESAATEPFAAYLQESFAAGGVKMGEGGLQVKCVHTQQGSLKFETYNQRFSGSLDIAVLPFGSMDYESQLRMGVELKHNQDDKDRYKASLSSSATDPHGGQSSSRKRAAHDTATNEEKLQIDKEEEEEGVDPIFR